MRKIILTQGKYALVDDRDFEELSKFKWTYAISSDSGYAIRRVNGVSKTIYMHREVLGTTDDRRNKFTDHINRNGLDNRRENLRICNHSQNAMNSKLRRGSKSGIRGVSWDKISKKWYAQLCHQGRNYALGRFNTKEKAQEVYQTKARELFGEFAS